MWHIVKPLLRRPLMPLLIVLQIAVACAICCNALFLLQQKLAPILTPTGISRPDHLVILHNILAHGAPWSAARMRAIEAGMHAVPGVGAVTYAISLPLAPGMRMQASVEAVGAHDRAKATTLLYIGDHLSQVLGLHLVAGRAFTPEEDVNIGTDMGFHHTGPVIITRALADRLFPDGHALGRRIGYVDSRGGERTVVGVVARLTQNYYGQAAQDLGFSMLFPGVGRRWAMPVFAARISTPDATQACKSLRAVIRQDIGSRMLPGYDIQCDTAASLRGAMLAQPRAAVWLLAGVTLIVLLVTLTGVMGLTGYWVQQRTKEIGIRRALGATRGDILRHVQTENALVVAVGAVLGLIAAYGVNLWLMGHYELLRLPWVYLPIGAAVLLVLGQLAVLVPALRASRVPPVVATRSV